MSKRVPDGWFTKTVGDIGPFYNGLSGKTSKDFGQGEPFLTYLQVFNKTLSVKEQAGLVSVDEGEKQEKVQYGDILFTTSSETPDEVGMAAVSLEKSWSPYLNSFCFGLRPKEEFPLSPEFANHFFRGDKFREDMRPLAQGSTRFNLSKENLKKLSVILPPPPEQKKIASILTSVDEVIENTQRQIDKLQDLKKATMKELLTKGIGHTEFKDSELGRIPKSWKTMKLDDFCLRVTDGTHDSPKRTYEGYRLVTSKNLKNGHLNLTDTYTISADDYREIEKRSKVDVNDILFGMIGTVGNPVTVSSYDLPFAIKNVALLKFGGDVNKSRWSFFYLDSELLRQRIKNDQTGSTQNFVGLGYMRNLRIPVPATSEMKEIVNIAEGILSHLDNLQVKLLALKFLKKSLMQDLLTGKVRVKVN